MTIKKVNTKVKGTARVSKYNDGKDPENAEPDEIVEKKFYLDGNHANEIAHKRGSLEVMGDELRVGLFSDRSIHIAKNKPDKE